MNLLRWQDRPTVQETRPDIESGDQLALVGNVLAQLYESEGWKIVMEMLDQEYLKAAISGHADTSKRPGYYEGLLNGMRRIPELVEETISKAAIQEKGRPGAPEISTDLDASDPAADRAALTSALFQVADDHQ